MSNQLVIVALRGIAATAESAAEKAERGQFGPGELEDQLYQIKKFLADAEREAKRP